MVLANLMELLGVSNRTLWLTWWRLWSWEMLRPDRWPKATLDKWMVQVPKWTLTWCSNSSNKLNTLNLWSSSSIKCPCKAPKLMPSPTYRTNKSTWMISGTSKREFKLRTRQPTWSNSRTSTSLGCNRILWWWEIRWWVVWACRLQCINLLKT